MTNVSKSMFLKSGLDTSGLIDAVLFVGPIAPQTNLGLAGVFLVTNSQASLAICAAATLMS